MPAIFTVYHLRHIPQALRFHYYLLPCLFSIFYIQHLDIGEGFLFIKSLFSFQLNSVCFIDHKSLI